MNDLDSSKQMLTLTFNGQDYTANGNENVLDTLLRNNIHIPHGCRAGACHACMLVAKPEQIPEDCQQGLSHSRIMQGCFLSCRCTPEKNMTLQLPDLSGEKYAASIVEKTLLNSQTLRLRLHCRLRWRAGQYITFWLNTDTARCYSIASVANLDDFIELHIRIYPNGAVSPQLLNANLGEHFFIQGPYGDCVYDNKQGSKNLLLIAAGTGLAPLLGISRDALHQGQVNRVRLLFTVRQPSDYYALDTLAKLQGEFPQFSYTLANEQGLASETWQQQLQTGFTELRNHQVYICGSDGFVRQAKKQCFMQGAKGRDIICEEFINFSEGT